MNWGFAWVPIGWTMLGSLCSCSPAEEPASIVPVKKRAQALVVPTKSFTLTIPPQAVSGRAALVASQNISVSDRVQIDDSHGGWSSISSLNGSLVVGASARVGNVWAGSSVTLRSNAVVTGNVSTAGSITTQWGAQVTGQQRPFAPAQSVVAEQLSIEFPPETNGNLEVPNDATHTLSPGRYGQTTLRARSLTTLGSGTYYFDTLTVEPNAELRVDGANGPTFIYVDSSLDVGGRAVGATALPEILWGYFGTAPVSITGWTAGRLVAPNATVTLSSQREHRGQFLAKNLTIEADTKISYWGFLDSAFMDGRGVPIGACSNRTAAVGQAHTVCLDNAYVTGDRLEVYVNGHLTPHQNHCVEVTLAEPSVEVRAFAFQQAQPEPSSSHWVFLAPPSKQQLCPLYENPVFGTYGDDELVGTAGADYISGGPGNDFITAGTGFDVLVGGDGKDVIDFGDLRPVIIESSTVIADADDALLVSFRPGNPEGLFQNVIGNFSTDQVRVVRKDLELTSELLASEEDFARALFTGSSPPSSAARGDVPTQANAALPEVKFDNIWGEIHDVATSGRSIDGEGYLLAVRQEIAPTQGVSCGVKERCVFSSVIGIDAEGKRKFTLTIPREEHYITGIASGYVNGGSEIAIAVGYSMQMIDDATCEQVQPVGACRDFQPFYLRFYRHTGELATFEYLPARKFDDAAGHYTNEFAHGAIYGIHRSPNHLAFVGEAVRNLQVQEVNGQVTYSGDIRAFVWAGDRVLPESGFPAAKVITGVDVDGSWSTLTRAYSAYIRDGGNNKPATIHVGGTTRGGQPWIASLRYDEQIAADRWSQQSDFEQPELELIGQKSLFNGYSSDEQVAAITSFGIVGWTSAFNTPARGFATSAGFFQPFSLDTPSVPQRNNGPFFTNDQNIHLFGGAVSAALTDASNHSPGVFVGAITHPWSPSLLTSYPSSIPTGRHGLVIRPSWQSQTELITSIVHGTSEQPVEVNLLAVDGGPNKTSILAGSLCVPTVNGCAKNPYVVVVDEELRRGGCPDDVAQSHCTDGKVDCGEQGIDCGPVCSNTCEIVQAPEPPVTTPVDPPGTGPEDTVDHAAMAPIYATECSACHGANGEGSQFFPCLKQVEPGCVAAAIAPGGSMAGQLAPVTLSSAERDLFINYILALSGTCGAVRLPSCN